MSVKLYQMKILETESIDEKTKNCSHSSAEVDNWECNAHNWRDQALEWVSPYTYPCSSIKTSCVRIYLYHQMLKLGQLYPFLCFLDLYPCHPFHDLDLYPYPLLLLIWANDHHSPRILQRIKSIQDFKLQPISIYINTIKMGSVSNQS